jgi:hypothetical protein
MNVKPGDIAMVKAPYVEPGRGAIVEVVRRAGEREWLSGREYRRREGYCVGWVVRGWVRNADGNLRGPELAISDVCLRPLRDSDEEDEMLRIAGKPSEVTA